MIVRRSLLFATLAMLGLGGCGLIGPDYVRPAIALPEAWKTAPAADPALWRAADPADALPKAQWWTLFGDPQLNDLEDRALADSPSLAASIARLDQANAQAASHGAALAPTVQLAPSVSRTRTSANRPLAAPGTPLQSTTQTDYRPVLTVSYEIDWLGRVRRDIEGARATAQQAQADTENVRLVLTAQVAAAYFQVRQLDEEIAAVTESSGLQEKVLRLVTRRYQLGASSQADLAQQTALMESTRAQLKLLQAQRNQQEDALATLTGTPAPAFKLPAGRLPASAPFVPLGLPSGLLERRPDIASAERAMAAANAQIGVARAAYFPILNLTPSFIGYESRNIAHLFSAPSLIWSLGLAATETLFDGGRTKAGVTYAEAGYGLAVANYRQAVLAAVQEAQDALGNVQQLDSALTNQQAALTNQNKAFELGLKRYQEGLDSAINLATTQQNLLATQRTRSQIAGSRHLAVVSLIKALGGGWQGLEQSDSRPSTG